MTTKTLFAASKAGLDTILLTNGIITVGEGVSTAPGCHYSYIGDATLDGSTTLLPYKYGMLYIDPSVYGEEAAATKWIDLQPFVEPRVLRQVLGVAAFNPASTVPFAVTMRQARMALLAAGKLAAVNAALAALPEPQKTAAAITWEYSTEVQRSNGLVPQMAAALGMTSAEIDALFIAAQNL